MHLEPTGDVYALIAEVNGADTNCHAWPAVASTEPPESAVRFVGGRDPTSLVLSAYPALDSNRQEAPRPVYVCNPRPLRANVPGINVHGDSAELALGLAALADLYDIRLAHHVYATGAVAPDAGGRVTAVRYLTAKMAAAIAHAQSAATSATAKAVLVIPACQWEPGGGASPELCVSESDRARLQAAAKAAGIEIQAVTTLAAAATTSLAADFLLVPGLIAEARQCQRQALYDYDYEATIACVERLCTALAPLHEHARLAAILRAEAHAIGAWAASRLRPDRGVQWRGARVLVQQVLRDMVAARDAALMVAGGSLWPETEALIANLDAAAQLGPPVDFSAGLRRSETALAKLRLSDGPHGEFRKLLGTQAQLRWRAGARAFATGQDADGEGLLARSIDEARHAMELARHSDVVDLNDRARVRTYLANALITRGHPADRQDARSLLAQVLGLDDELRHSEAPQQDPGWALRVLYLDLVRDPSQSVARHWRDVGQHLRIPPGPQNRKTRGGMTLGEALAGQWRGSAYDDALAALIARDALATGDVVLAAEMVRYAWVPKDPTAQAQTKVSLRRIVWWWPLRALPWGDEPHPLNLLREALANVTGPLVDRPEGPSRDRFVSDVLEDLAGDSPRHAQRAWRRLALWLGEPDPTPLETQG